VLAAGLLGFSFGSSFSSVPVAAYVVSLGVAGLHAYCAVMDYSADKAAGQSTIAVYFGKRFAMVFALLCSLVGFVFFLVNSYPLAMVFLSFVTSFVYIVLIIYPSQELAYRLLWWVLAVGFVCAVIVLSRFV
jgi:4-hydroxybenzoate polyprenyltransferase